MLFLVEWSLSSSSSEKHSVPCKQLGQSDWQRLQSLLFVCSARPLGPGSELGCAAVLIGIGLSMSVLAVLTMFYKCLCICWVRSSHRGSNEIIKPPVKTICSLTFPKCVTRRTSTRRFRFRRGGPAPHTALGHLPWEMDVGTALTVALGTAVRPAGAWSLSVHAGSTWCDRPTILPLISH